MLTASGGPFRGRRRDDLHDVTVEQALAHPTWDMGPVVTINSATLVNKGLEVIEAHLLFDVPLDRVDVVVHPQSVVHSMVEFVDGSTLAQASPPDMRLPIALGLGWPDRVPGAARRLRLDHGVDLGVPAARRRGVPGRPAGPRGRRGRRHARRPSTTPPTRSASRRSSRAGCAFTGIVDTLARVLDEHEVGNLGSRRRMFSMQRPGPGSGPPALTD